MVYLSDVSPICNSFCNILERKQISDIVEAPLVKACEFLYDLNVKTLDTSANQTSKGKTGYCHVIIDYCSLSLENKKISEELGEIFTYCESTKAVMFQIPLNDDSTIEDIESISLSLFKPFKQQEMTWVPRYTIDALRGVYCIPLDVKIVPSDFSDFFYDENSELFYLSQEHFQKVNQ